MLMPLRLMLMHEPVLVPLRHGRSLEVKGEVAHAETLRQQVFDALLVGLRILQPLGLHDDVGSADCQVAADAPGAQVFDARDARQPEQFGLSLLLVEGGAMLVQAGADS